MDAERIELESRLLRQEHRFFALLSNLITRNAKYPDVNDPRRSAITKAFWFNLIFSPTMVAGGGGLVALLSAYLLYQQNRLLQSSLFPAPKFTAMLRPMVGPAAVKDSADAIRRPDIGIEERVVECAFAANDGGTLLVSTVNLKVTYTDSAENVLRAEVFEARSETRLPVVAKSTIVPVELKFKRFGDLTAPPISLPKSNGPIRVGCEFSFTGVDSAGSLWSADLKTDVIVIDDGELDTRNAAIYLNGSGDALRAVFRRGPPDSSDGG